MPHASLVRPFRELTIRDVAIVGGKNASLGELIRSLSPKGIRVPDGFATTSHAFRLTLKHAGLDAMIRDTLKGLQVKNLADLQRRGAKIRTAVANAELPPELDEAIRDAYRTLARQEGMKDVDVAVRSSATAEDLPGASFAGQQETYLNIRGENAVIDAVRRCYASLFTDRAIAYRIDKGFDHTKVALSVGVQRMVRSDKSASGVMFSLDTESGFRDVVLINAAWGLGESVVQGAVSPDQYYVFKPFLSDKTLDPIVSRRVGQKEEKIIYNAPGSKVPTKTVKTDAAERRKLCLTDEEILTLARWAVEIEAHYSKEAGEPRPMDMEWAKDGINGKLYIVQARPETVQAGRDLSVLKTYELKKRSRVLVEGLSVGSAIGKGTVRVISDIKHADSFRQGDVLVTTMTDPDWVPLMKKASAIVTDSGGRTCHAAIVARELGVPAVVGTRKGTKALKTGQQVTVSCADGEDGRVYEGALPFNVKTTELKGLGKPKTSIMLNIGQPDIAFNDSFIPNEGVGLARTEFIFTDYIKVHPLALINFKKLKDAKLKKEIEEITYPYKDKTAYFVDRLAEGIARLAAAFYPKDVIVRTSDFKTNEYAGLVGGTIFEPVESNPMIGWRGCSRYYDPAFRPAFELECAAIKKVREEMGFENVVVMLPFCRTPKEGDLVLDVMAKAGLRRGVKNLRVYVMVEIPSNIILGEEYAKRFDGFSIGSNDLTQLTLGVDRDSSIVSKVYDESNEAVLESIRKIIAIGKKNKVKVGFCGQAPSDSIEFAKFLVDAGIDSISLNPDTVVKTTIEIIKQEKSK